MLIHNTFTATATEQNSQFPAEYLMYITNDGQNSVEINLNFPIGVYSSAYGGEARVLLKAGETINDIPVRVSRIYYRAISGTSSIRIAGVKRYESY